MSSDFVKTSPPQFFYVPGISGSQVYLDETESIHCIRVLRMTRGSLINLVDGSGGLYHAMIADPSPRRCEVQITGTVKEFGKRNHYLNIAIAPVKNADRFEWFAEKSAEIGIDEISPVICANSEKKTLNTRRIGKILVAAMKQSRKAYLPKINQPVPLIHLLTGQFDGEKYIAHCGAGEREHLKDKVSKNGKVLILIGPEGDFAPDEIDTAKKYGFSEVSLGRNLLRTETAGVLACLIVNLLNE